MPSSGGPSPFGWTTSSPSSPDYSLAPAWTFRSREETCHVRGPGGRLLIRRDGLWPAATLVGVTGFEPAASSSRTSRNRNHIGP